MAKKHILKTWTEYFNKIEDGTKTFELRKDDRNFKVGDILVLKDYDRFRETFTGRTEFRIVTYKLDGGAFGLEKGFCVLGLK